MGAKTPLVTSGAPTATTTGATQYWFLSTAAITVPQTAEANRQVLYRSSGVLSKLYVRVTANSTSATSTVVVRNNASDAALTFTIPAGTTGVFEDTTNTVTVAAGDKLCYKTISGGTGTMSISVMSCVFQATTSAVSRLTNGPPSSGYVIDSVTRFAQLVGTLTPNTATESVTKTKMVRPGTFRNLGVFVSANARTSATTIKSRKNGVDGNITLTIGATTTGWFEDTSNTDIVTVGDDYGWTVLVGSGSGESLSIQSMSCDFVDTTEGLGLMVSSGTAGLVQSANVTNYIPVGGNVIGASTTEANTKVKSRETFTLSGLTLFTSANTVTATSTLRLRINGAPGNQVISIPASTASVISDSSHIDLVTDTDDLDYELTTGATGTSLTIRNISMNVVLLSRVSKSNTLINNILARVSKSLTLKYHILGRISKSVSLRYNILTRVTKSFILRFNILGRIGKTLSVRYNIMARVSKTNTIKLNILSRVSKQTTLKYNILARVSKQISLRHNILGRISKSLSLRYNILGRVSRQISLKNNILQRVSKSLTIRYNIVDEILIRISKTLTLINNIEERVSKSITIRNKIVGFHIETETERKPSILTTNTGTIWGTSLERQSKVEDINEAENQHRLSKYLKHKLKNSWLNRLG